MIITTELTLPIRRTVLWTDSTTVLSWLQSNSCRFKVFVGTRVAEIQELTGSEALRYINSEANPADDLTRGKTLANLAEPNRWTDRPYFLLRPQDDWPTPLVSESAKDTSELRRSVFCGITANISADNKSG